MVRVCVRVPLVPSPVVCLTAEARVVSQREEKARLLDDVMECERQIVLWEKKIALERETQEALDPTEGEARGDGLAAPEAFSSASCCHAPSPWTFRSPGAAAGTCRRVRHRSHGA